MLLRLTICVFLTTVLETFLSVFLKYFFQVSFSQQCEKMAVPGRSQPDQENRRGIQQQLK